MGAIHHNTTLTRTTHHHTTPPIAHHPHPPPTHLPHPQRRENLAHVVNHLRSEFDLAYVYVWHALAGYWNGIATTEAVEVAKYQAEIIDVRPPASVLEVEPAMAWNPSTVAGLGALRDPAVLYQDMHEYLAHAGVYRGGGGVGNGRGGDGGAWGMEEVGSGKRPCLLG